MTPSGQDHTDDDPRFVYSFWNVDDHCLYVGCTVNFARRLTDHQRLRTWFGEVVRIDVRRHPDLATGMAAEAALIRALNPVHNDALTDHAKPKRRPCKRCRTGAHDECLTVNAHGVDCPCSVCFFNATGKRAS